MVLNIYLVVSETLTSVVCEKGVDIPAGIVTKDKAFAHCWGDEG